MIYYADDDDDLEIRKPTHTELTLTEVVLYKFQNAISNNQNSQSNITYGR